MLKIVDHIGNQLKPGRLLRWQPKDLPDLYVKVMDVVEPTATTPGKVEVVMMFGIAPQERKEGAIQFKDFVTVFDPESELKAEAAVQHGLKSMSAR